MPSSKFTGKTTTDMVSQTFTPVNAYLTYAFDNGLVVGIGVFNPYGLGTEWPTDWPGQQMSVKTDLTTWYINPTVAYKFSDKFSVGVGVSYVAASVKLSQRVGTLGSLAPLAPAPVDGTVSLDGTGNGFNFDAGLLYKATDDLSIGVSYRHLTKIDFSGNAAFSGMAALANFFPGGTGKTTLPFPSSLFAGIAYNVTKDLTVEADYQYVGWSSYDQLSLNIPAGPASPLGGPQKGSVLVKNWDNGYLLRIGGEYRMDKFAIRAGFIYDKTPQPDAVVEPMLPDANRTEITLGLGYQFSKNVAVNAMYQLISFADRNGTLVSKTALYPAIPAVVTPGTYSNSANLLGVNLALSF